MNGPHEKRKTKALIKADHKLSKTFYFTKIFVSTEL